MPTGSRRQSPNPGKSRPDNPANEPGDLRQRLQILAGFLLPLLVLSLWLNSRGFFDSP